MIKRIYVSCCYPLPSKLLVPQFEFPLLPGTICDGFAKQIIMCLVRCKCKQLVRHCLSWTSSGDMGMINDLLFDIFKHVGDAVSHHVILMSTPNTLSLLGVSPIILLRISPMSLASF